MCLQRLQTKYCNNNESVLFLTVCHSNATVIKRMPYQQLLDIGLQQLQTKVLQQ